MQAASDTSSTGGGGGGGGNASTAAPHTPRKWRLRPHKGRGADADSSSTADKHGAASLPPVPFLQLFRFTTARERALMALGCVAAALHGALEPLWTILLGDIVQAFGTADALDVVDTIGGLAKWFFVIGAGAFVASFVQVRTQMMVATAVSVRIRALYFNSLMRQDRAWYDRELGGELTARVASDVNVVQAGIGDKVGSAIQYVCFFPFPTLFVLVSVCVCLCVSFLLTSKFTVPHVLCCGSIYCCNSFSCFLLLIYILMFSFFFDVIFGIFVAYDSCQWALLVS